MEHPKPDKESVYDSKISPLIRELVKVCKSTTPMIPIATFSTFFSEENQVEGSCSSLVVPKNTTSLRMEQVAKCAMSRNGIPMSVNARVFLGERTDFTAKELDKIWFKSTQAHEEAMKAIHILLEDIVQLVDHEYCFPTAIVIQNPGFLTGCDCYGKHNSKQYEQIKYMKTIASNGFTPKACRFLIGSGLGEEEGSAIISMISRNRIIDEVSKKGPRALMKELANQELEDNLLRAKEALKKGEIMIPFLRVGEGDEEEFDKIKHEETTKKIEKKVKIEATENAKRRQAVRKRSTIKKKKVKKRKRGLSLNWETPSQKIEKELARKDRKRLTKSIRDK